jgi:hypothetical protein
MGFLVGWMEGAMIAQTLGSHLLSRTIAGFLIGWVPVWLERANPLMPILASIALVLTADSLLFLMAPRGDWLEWSLRLTGKFLYNGVLALPIYLVLKRWIPPEQTE